MWSINLTLDFLLVCLLLIMVCNLIVKTFRVLVTYIFVSVWKYRLGDLLCNRNTNGLFLSPLGCCCATCEILCNHRVIYTYSKPVLNFKLQSLKMTLIFSQSPRLYVAVCCKSDSWIC